MAKLSLLEQAKQIRRGDKRLKNISPEEIEVALAWMVGEITGTQAAKVLGVSTPGAVVSRIAILIREAYRLGLLRIKK